MRSRNAGWLGLVVAATVLVGSEPAPAQIDLPSAYADPSKFVLFGCPQLAQARPGYLARKRDLENLMAKAEAGPGGGAVSMMAYRSEYLSVIGDLRNLEARAADRNCPPARDSAPANRSPQQGGRTR